MPNRAVMTGDARAVKELGREAGFDLVRITAASPLHEERARYLAWLEQGRQAEMKWMTADRAAVSSTPEAALTGAKSVVCVGLSYWAGHREPPVPGSGTIARYAWGRDYHAVLGDGLKKLAGRLREAMGGDHRWYVDTGPVMDKALAARSGLGWYGKNTNILTSEFGSYVLLGEILTTLELAPDAPLGRDCGACHLCSTACPTGALGPDYSIDAGKCISYLTIEHRGAIPLELRSAIGSWVFGCDICQDVCPPTMLPHLRTSAARREWSQEVRRVLAGETIDGPWISEPEPRERRTANAGLFADGIRQAFDLRRCCASPTPSISRHFAAPRSGEQKYGCCGVMPQSLSAIPAQGAKYPIWRWH